MPVLTDGARSDAESGSPEVADRQVDSITSRFSLLSSFPQMGRRRDHDFRIGVRSHAVGEYLILYRIEGEDVLILRMIHGRRDLDRLFE